MGGLYEFSTSVLHKLQYGGAVMFPIYYGQTECGNAVVERQGLYCTIHCECKVITKLPCKITLQTEDARINLGTCIRVGDIYVIDTKIPSKRINEKQMVFRIYIPGSEDCDGFFPIGEDMPFPHLNRLDSARMRQSNGRTGVIFTGQAPEKPDNGLIP